MHRIDTATAVNSLFVEKDPVLGLAPTEVSGDWLNAVQEEIVSTIEGSGLVLDKADNTQLLQAIDARVAPGVFRKNALINAAFSVNQRFPTAVVTVGVAYTSATTEPYYVDRWRFQIPTGAGDLRVLQDEHPLDVTAETLPQNLVAPQFFLNLNAVAGFANEPPTMSQRIEDVRTFAGLKVALSFYARINAGSTQVVPKLIQDFGSTGSSPVTLTRSPITLTSSWNRYTASFTLGSLAGKTVGLFTGAPDHYLEALLEFDQSATFDVDVSHVQLERGVLASEFEAVREADELLSCLRYYEKSTNGDHAPSVSEVVSTVNGAYVPASGLVNKGANRPFKVVKRDEPTMTWYTGGVGASTPDRILWGGVVRTVAGTEASSRSAYATGSPECTTAPASLDEYECNWEADAEL